MARARAGVDQARAGWLKPELFPCAFCGQVAAVDALPASVSCQARLLYRSPRIGLGDRDEDLTRDRGGADHRGRNGHG